MRTGHSLPSALILLGAVLAAPLSSQERAEEWGPLTGINELRIRVPVSGRMPEWGESVDPRTLYYLVRDFLLPRAPGISIAAGNPAYRLEVRFSFRDIPPEREEPLGILVLSRAWLASQEELMAERGHTGTGPPPLHPVRGLQLWASAPEYAFVEDGADLQREVRRMVEAHLNRFLDAWFRDNAGR